MGRYYSAIQRAAIVTNEDFGIRIAVRDDKGDYMTFDSAEDAKQYVIDNDITATYPNCYILELGGLQTE